MTRTDMTTPGEPRVMTSGHFLYLHAGHIRLLEYCKSLGRVTVALNGQYYHQVKYANNAIPLEDRRQVLLACRYVDDVIVFDESTPAETILRMKPDYFIKGPDYKHVVLPEQHACDIVGCRVRFFDSVKTHLESSSYLLRLRE